MMVLLLTVVVGAAALAINWSYLTSVFSHMQQAVDTIALAAAPKILDDAVLCDMTCDNIDEQVETKTVATVYRNLVNSLAATQLHLQDADVTCTLGNIADTRLRLDDFSFTAGAPANALKIVAHRSAGGANPVTHLISGLTSTDTADVVATSYALLDNQVVGFCPRTNVLAPVIPLAIDRAAFDARVGDLDGDGIREFMLLLNSTDPAATDDATGALVDLGGAAIDLTRIQTQVDAGGLSAADLPGGKLGPLGIGPTLAYPNNPNPLLLSAEQDSPAEATIETIIASLQAIAASDNPTRVFPVYTSVASGDASVVDFIAANVISAIDESEGATPERQRLKVTIEPCYLIHTTAWTKTDAAPRDVYVRRLRLIR